MVSPTENPRLWRVEFDVMHSDRSKSGVVCYLYLVEAGLRIYYAYHRLYSRPIAKGPWESHNQLHQPLDSTLKATIEAGLFQEIWSLARTDEILAWPGDTTLSVLGVDLGL